MSRSVWSHAWRDVNFGYMHEDPAIERSLMPASGTALCVLSGGDMAYCLAGERRRIVAVDVNPAQLRLNRLKQAAVIKHSDLKTAASLKVRDVLADADVADQLDDDDLNFWGQRGRSGRPLVATGHIDARLRFISRWIAPWVMPSQLLQALRQESPARPVHFDSFKWWSAWSLLRLGIAVSFPLLLRRHLPTDLSQRLRTRFERACIQHDPANNPLLKRMLSPDPASAAGAFQDTWPASNKTQIIAVEGPLETQSGQGPFDLVAASNILDTSHPSSLTAFLEFCSAFVEKDGLVIIRSLFRDAEDWPTPPKGWEVAETLLAQAHKMDRAPLCRVSLVVRRLG